MFTWNYINCVENRFDLRFRPGGLSHRIEINQKPNSCENLSPFFQCTCPKYAINMPFWRHIDTILASSRCTFDLAGYDICRLRRLTFCWRFVLIRSYIRKKLAVRTAGGTCQDGILMAMMRCVRWHAWGQLQRCWHLVGTSGYQAPTVLPCYMWVKNILKLVTFKLFFCSQF